MKLNAITLLIASLLVAATVSAGSSGVPPTVTTTGAGSQTKTTAYVGLNWTLGGGMTPALVLGVFDTKVQANGDTTGGNLAFHANLAGGISLGKVKLSYLDGRNDLQGELGLGFDFMKQAPLLFLGINAPYVAAGIDAFSSHGFVPYAAIHTQGRFDKPAGTTTTISCNDPNYPTYNAVTNLCDFAPD